MKVMLLENVKKLGKAGEVVDISDGYAKNYILPQKLGKEATKEVLNEWKLKKGSEQNHQAQERAQALETAERIAGKTLSLKIKGGENGRLFGAVTTQDIAEALASQLDLAVDKKKIVIKEAIKNEGTYDVVIKLHAVATPIVKVAVEATK